MLKLIQINIEGSRHLDKWIPFINDEHPDIVCMQEVFLKDIEEIENKTGMICSFKPTCNKNENAIGAGQNNGIEGVGFLTKRDIATYGFYYFGNGDVPVFVLSEQKDRYLLHAKFKKEGKLYTVATTHFVWTPDASCSDDQRTALKKLLTADTSDMILCGDFNAPRPGEIYQELTKVFKDNIPEDVENTLDPKYHKRPDLRLVVDYVFTSKNYKVEKIKLVNGVSDHKAIVALIKSV